MSTAEVYEALATQAAGSYPEEAARALEPLAAVDIAAWLGGLEPSAAAGVFAVMAPLAGREALAELEADAAAVIADRLPAPSAASLLRGASSERVEAILGALAAPRRRAIRAVLAYRADRAGALADVDVLSAAPDASAAETLEMLRVRGPRGNLIYVVDRPGRFIGLVSVARVVAAPGDTSLGELAEPEPDTVDARSSLADLGDHPGWLRWRALPVIDSRGRFVGVLHYERVHRALVTTPRPARSLSLPLSAAELLWVGLTGMVEGLGRAVEVQRSDG